MFNLLAKYEVYSQHMPSVLLVVGKGSQSSPSELHVYLLYLLSIAILESLITANSKLCE